MKKEFLISEITTGKLNALVKNLMAQMNTEDPEEAIRLINSGKWTVIDSMKNWYEKDGIIYFTIVSDGTTGQNWIKRLVSKGHTCENFHSSTELLLSKNFIPTNGIVTEIAVIPGELIDCYHKNPLFIEDVHTEGKKRNWQKPNIDTGCLIREMISNKEIKAMGVSRIIVMSDTIKVGFEDKPCLLSVGGDTTGNGTGKSCLYSDHQFGTHLSKNVGYAFAVSQISNR